MSSFDFAHGLAQVGPIHLIRAAVAELRGGVGGLAEGTVEARGELRSVGKNGRVLEAGLIERVRMAATRPSIMSEGAMMSMPARASETEVRARSSRLASLSIS